MTDATEQWVQTLRERTHKLTTTCAALELQAQILGKKVEVLSAEVRRMATADEIAQGVADELRRRDRGHREKIDASMKRTAWLIGSILGCLQIALAVFAFKH